MQSEQHASCIDVADVAGRGFVVGSCWMERLIHRTHTSLMYDAAVNQTNRSVIYCTFLQKFCRVMVVFVHV